LSRGLERSKLSESLPRLGKRKFANTGKCAYIMFASKFDKSAKKRLAGYILRSIMRIWLSPLPNPDRGLVLTMLMQRRNL
jgi:hypothetical protein